jgi:cytochrome c oxidase subunit 4
MYLAAAARLARQRAPVLHRTIATTVTSPSAPASSSTPTPISLSNVEATWTTLAPEEKASVHQQLEEVQKKDWRELSIDEKKAGE